MAARGCGPARISGGVYACCDLSPFGRPLEDFVICPPIKLTKDALDALGLTPVGVKLIEREGVWHVLDWVGSQHYENVCDVLEEIRHLGMSRRLPVTLEFEKLSKRSRHILVHARGWIDNAAEYHKALAQINPTWSCATCGDVEHGPNKTGRCLQCGGDDIHADAEPYAGRFAAKACPRDIDGHDWPAEPVMCAQHWWSDVAHGEPIGESEHNRSALLVSGACSTRAVVRRLPSFYYTGLSHPDGVEPHYTPAMIASFPITRLAVIRDPQGGTHERAAKAASKSSLAVELEDE